MRKVNYEFWVETVLEDTASLSFAWAFATASGGVGLGLEELLADVDISFCGLLVLLWALNLLMPGL